MSVVSLQGSKGYDINQHKKIQLESLRNLLLLKFLNCLKKWKNNT